MQVPLEVILERDQLQQVVEINTAVAVIGRGQDCDIRIDDPLASRHHCRLEIVNNQVFLVDLDSRNGSWMAGERVQRRIFTASDVLRIGSTTLQIHGGIEHRLDAIESTQTQQVSREQQSLNTLMAVVKNLQVETRTPQLAAMVVDAAISLCRAERGFMFLLDGEKISFSVARNFAHEIVAAPEEKFSHTLIKRAIDSEYAVVIDDATSDSKFSGVESISDLGLRSVVAVALRHQSRIIGVLAIDHRLTGGAFGLAESEMLNSLAVLSALNFANLQQQQVLTALQRRNAHLKKGTASVSQDPAMQLQIPAAFEEIVGDSVVMKKLFADIEKVMNSNVPVVIYGESGTGKELVARALHFESSNADSAFVVENCGALSESLLESELFGHVKGAFTGASQDRVGRIVEADGGTIFLDEVAEMSDAMQTRLLRVLQNGEVRPVGSDKVLKVKVRVIAATHQDLLKHVQRGAFREDLYYRLQVVSLNVPPLRKRTSDIPQLFDYLMRQVADEAGTEVRHLSPEALEALQVYSWPGNIRELRNEVQRLSMLDDGEVNIAELSATVLKENPREKAVEGISFDDSITLPERIKAVEVQAIGQLLDLESGNRTLAARALGISRYALSRKIEKYKLDVPEDE
ncbi:MAG: transcriptional regulator with GAF, ATPase, and Fis domain [Myxococcota bacterium]|jgi:transcriptional regulator with GAF, ATPase, and Fis domain